MMEIFLHQGLLLKLSPASRENSYSTG